MDTKEVLACALETLRDPQHWIKCAMARTADWETCAVTDDNAAMFCMAGAISKCVNWNVNVAAAPEAYLRAIDALTEALPHPTGWEPWSITSFNDSPNTKHEDVIAIFEQALEAA